MTLIKKTIFLCALLLAGIQTGIANEPPPPPQEIFRYAAFDAGDAIEIDWAIDDAAYMYRDSFGFSVASGPITLGAPDYPEGKVYVDEFLGEQVIYRDNIFISIPYTVSGDRPESVELTIESRGCLDSGFCYMPQTWTETVTLKQAKTESKKLSFGSVASNSEDQPLPAEEVFSPYAFAIDGNNVEFGFRTLPGYYLYKSKISLRAVGNNVQAGRIDLPKGKLKTDEFFGEQEVYFDEVSGKVAIARATPEAIDLQLELSYQGCKEDGICYLPQTVVLDISLPEATAVTDLSTLPDAGVPVSEQGRIAEIIGGSPLWYVILAMFGFGLLLALTPCVLPMIPILTSIIAGEGEDVTPVRGFTLALSYVMGMALIYTAAGVFAVAAGAQVQAAFNQPWVLSIFAGLFVVLAIAMFGAFDLQMPSSIQSRLATISNNQKSGTMVGAFVMGALSSLIVTACVAPALVAALAVMSQSGDYFRGGIALFAMSLGMGAPLLAVGAAQGKFLPQAGAWMVAVKGAFGFMLLGLAIWMLARFMPGGVIMAMWAVLVFITGVFMGGMTTLTTESSVVQKLGKGFGGLAIIYGILLVIGAATGGTNPLKPLASVNLGGGGAATGAAHEELPFQRIKTVDDLDREIANASANGKTVLLDFYADWCTTCLEMEAFTFTDSDVQAALSNTVWLQADVTRNDDEDQALTARFGVFGPPWIIFFDTEGQQRHGYDVVGEMKAPKFAAHVRQAFGETDATPTAAPQ